MAVNILYIHGMGGGGDSRIPSVLNECFSAPEWRGERINVIVRTYDFDPEVAHGQIVSWVAELRPSLVIGESLGSLQALRIRGVPHIFVSPSLNAPVYMGYLSFLALLPGVTRLLDRIYRPRPGDRQPLHFTFRTLHRYIAHRKAALSGLKPAHSESKNPCYAFFGDYDHYRRSGIVSIRTWKKYFGEGTWSTYPGTHFMEEEYIISMLVPKILEVLRVNQ